MQTKNRDVHFVREVMLGEFIFGETIYFSAEYGTARIYAKDDNPKQAYGRSNTGK